jgi:hypothetical protein
MGATPFRAWCELLDQRVVDVPPHARAALLPDWVSQPLIATEHARRRLRAWTDADRPDPRPEQLAYDGDPVVGAAVIDVVRRLPPPVRHHLVATCAVFGITTTGLYLSGVPLPTPLLTPVSVILLAVRGLSRVDVEAAAAHEFAHGWLTRRAQRTHSVAEFEDALSTVGSDPNLFDLVSRDAQRDERQACELARAWGFVDGPLVNAEQQAEAARQALIEDVRRAACRTPGA